MSWRASSYVKSLRSTPSGAPLGRTEKLVLLCIADYYNDEEGRAWPSVRALAGDALLSTRRVRQVLKALAAKGVLRIGPAFRDDGSQRSNSYTLPGLAEGEVISPPVIVQGG